MKSQKLGKPFDEFWDNQNQRLCANPDFLSDKGEIFDNVFYFKHHTGQALTRIDFSLFDLPHLWIKNVAGLQIGDNFSTLSSKDYAKLFFVSALPGKSAKGASAIYQMLLHLFAFLKRYQAVELSPVLLNEFWKSFLGESVNERGFFNRISMPSHNAAIRPVKFIKVRNRLHSMGVDGVIDKKLIENKVSNSLDEVCVSMFSITLKEYRKGGSSNFLGLELGQYYVDYLRQVYQGSYLYMVVCKETLAIMLDDTDISKLTKNKFSNLVLSSLTLQSMKREIELDKELQSKIEEVAYSVYEQQFNSAMALNDASIEELVFTLGLEMRFDAVEVIRILMLQKYLGLTAHKSPQDVWEGYLASLEKTFIGSAQLKNVVVDDIYTKMEDIIQSKKLSKTMFLTDLKKWGSRLLENATNTTYECFKYELNTVAYAMANLFVAWTGYRASEYGFPLNAIQPEPNLDILDNAYVPFRFKLKWFVPKTNLRTKIDREITSQCYQIAMQLYTLFGKKEESPCLYESTNSRHTDASNQSEIYVALRVKANWKGFVHNYMPFTEVLRLEFFGKK